MPKSPVIEPDVMDALRQAVCNERRVILPPKLDPKLYKRVDQVLQDMGGTWSKAQKSHVFEGDARLAINRALRTGVQRSPLAFDPRETAVLLACLRFAQRETSALESQMPDHFMDTPGAVSASEIDRLCQRING